MGEAGAAGSNFISHRCSIYFLAHPRRTHDESGKSWAGTQHPATSSVTDHEHESGKPTPKVRSEKSRKLALEACDHELELMRKPSP